jgi:hypothetical protein
MFAKFLLRECKRKNENSDKKKRTGDMSSGIAGAL